jgi:hypothetical protein
MVTAELVARPPGGCRNSGTESYIRRSLSMKLRARTSYCVCVLGGLAIGLLAGDRIFPSVEKAFGDPLADVVFGFAAFLLVALAWEVAGELHACFSRQR